MSYSMLRATMELGMTKVSSKGQVVIPGLIRDRLGLTDGSQLLVIDTNVLVSGIFFPKGNEAQILGYTIEGRAVLLASLDTLEELRKVLTRPKFQLTQPEVLAIFQMVLSRWEIVLNPEKAEARCRDPDDQKFLGC